MMNKTSTIVVTRHPALVEYLVKHRVVSQSVPVLTHASAEDVRGKHVIGVLPMHLASEARSVTEVPLTIPAEMRGKELTLEQVEEYARAPVTYKVERIATHPGRTPR